MFTKNSNKAPEASCSFHDHSISPNVTIGGSNATAIITPIRIAETPVVNTSAPALPGAKAMTTSSKFYFCS